jgi:hypothetical protein
MYYGSPRGILGDTRGTLTAGNRGPKTLSTRLRTPCDSCDSWDGRSARWILGLRRLHYRQNHVPIATHSQLCGLRIGRRQADALECDLFVVRGVGPSNVVVGRISVIGHVANCIMRGRRAKGSAPFPRAVLSLMWKGLWQSVQILPASSWPIRNEASDM